MFPAARSDLLVCSFVLARVLLFVVLVTGLRLCLGLCLSVVPFVAMLFLFVYVWRDGVALLVCLFVFYCGFLIYGLGF